MTASITNNIVLIGYRAAGKTTIGKSLRDHTGWQYLSTDAEIEAQIGEKISEFVEHAGWPQFRKIEQEVIAKLSGKKKLIIDCGGGVIEFPQNMLFLQQASFITWVDAPIEILKSRLRHDPSRPLLNQEDMNRDIEVNYRRRYPLYQKYANLRVDTVRQTKDQICQSILQAAGFLQ